MEVTFEPADGSKKPIDFTAGQFLTLHLNAEGMTPPFGHFGMNGKPAVLISAGIGATPMKAFLEANKGQVKMAVHVDRSDTTHPFRQEFVDSGVSTHFHY